MWEPVGPLPVTVYRRRRAVAVAFAFGVVVMLGVLVGRAAPADPDASATSERAVVASVDARPSAARPDGPRTYVSAPLSPAVRTDGAPPPCSNSMLAVAAEIDRAEYQVGQRAMLRLVVTNISSQPCVRDLDPARQEVVVWSADLATRLWSSNDCSNPSTVDVRTLLPNQPLGFQVTWAGRTTTPECEQKAKTVVPAGSYNVMTRVDDVSSPPTPFRRLPRRPRARKSRL